MGHPVKPVACQCGDRREPGLNRDICVHCRRWIVIPWYIALDWEDRRSEEPYPKETTDG